MLNVPRDLGAGLFLIAVGAFAFWQSSGLDPGTLRQVGPGMMPRALAVLTALCGIGIAAGVLFDRGERMERWFVRGPLFLLGAAVAFGLTVRPLGLVVAGPLAVIIGGFAGRDTRIVETLVFGAVMTVFCVVLFKLLLGLPIPVAPWLIGY
ncbi:MAG: tripartite tricarboxylate transporter TctB family protein [Rhodospirillales bacterium]